MYRINSNYKKGIFSQHKYNKYILILEDILEEYKKLPNYLYIRNYNGISISELRKSINEIKTNLKSISEECGAKSINDIIIMTCNTNLNELIAKRDTEYQKILIFYNKMFSPSSYKLIDKTIDKNKLCKDLSVVSMNENKLNVYDYENMSHLYFPTCKLLKKEHFSILEHVNGARMYIPIYNKLNEIDKILIMNGIFREDLLNISRMNGTIGAKNKKLLEILKNITSVNENFKYGFVEQLSLRDFIVYSNDKIIEMAFNAYSELLKLKEKTISCLVKEFLNKNVEEQRDMLTLFLLVKDDLEIQYLAYLMYDMISNESYLLKPQPLAEQVYNSLHWSIQKIFKIAIKKVGNYAKNIADFSEEDIPYEKRICIMKVPKHVKSKAMDKYKEVINKGGDSASKSQQYLDGILKIPFGNYRKEQILSVLNDFKTKLIHFNIELNEIVKYYRSGKNDNDHNNFLEKIITLEEVLNLFKTENKKHIKSKNIDESLKIIEDINNEINSITFLDILDNNFIKDTLNNYKYADLKNRIKYINYDLTVNDIDFKLKDKGRKSDLIAHLIILLNDKLENNKFLKKKYLYYLKHNTINLNYIDNEELNFYSKYYPISNKINEFSKEWSVYKSDSKEYLSNVKTVLDKAVYGQNDAKKEIERIIAQWMNGEMQGYCFGFEGPPGTGKTSLAKKGIAHCLKNADGNSRPFAFIAIGGSSNASTLEGHSYTYVGSTWGKIVDLLMENKCMNPIIYIDELDKISKTENGKEIIGILTHLTDSTQNDQFNDKYFAGINIDLSKVLFIFSYNDFHLIDPILADRIHRIKFHHLSTKDKVYIIEYYILPEILEMVGFTKDSILFNKESIEYIINNYTFEAGVRKLREKVFEIIREINLQYITNHDTIKFPINVTIALIEEIFSNKPKLHIKKIAPEPRIGLVNGLYATSCGIGGLTIIEAFKTIADAKLKLVLTGQQGDVMKESVQCAKTIAWNLIPNNIKKDIVKDWDENGPYGIHIHCPEAATPKDGPSAGLAITLAIVSLLTKIPVKNTIAMTGEIDLNGSAHMIGGLDMKIDGGKNAGVKTILCPKENGEDLTVLSKTKGEILENIDIIQVKDIWEVLDLCLIENDVTFIKYIL